MRISRHTFLSLLLSSPILAAGARQMHKLVSPAEFQQRIKKGGVVVVDVRTPQEHATAYIPHTDLRIDFFDPKFAAKIKALPTDKVYLVYCQSGHRSSKAVKIMEKDGFPVIYELDGGMMAWQAAGLPVEKGK